MKASGQALYAKHYQSLTLVRTSWSFFPAAPQSFLQNHSINSTKSFLLQGDSITLFSKYHFFSRYHTLSPPSSLPNSTFLWSREPPLGRAIVYALKNKLLPWPRNQACTPELLRKGNQEIVSTGKGLNTEPLQSIQFLQLSNNCTHQLLFPHWLLWGIPLLVFLLESSLLSLTDSNHLGFVVPVPHHSCCQFPAGKEPLPPCITPHGMPPLHLSIWFHFTFLSQRSGGEKKNHLRDFKTRMCTKKYPAD